jgi:Coenzyme PQQ synthesis protein D (PqqD)
LDIMTNVLGIVDDAVWTDLGDEVVILKLDAGIYFGLEQVGARIWREIAEGRTRDEIVKTVAAEYDASRDRVERDFDELVSDLSKEGLIRAAA